MGSTRMSWGCWSAPCMEGAEEHSGWTPVDPAPLMRIPDAALWACAPWRRLAPSVAHGSPMRLNAKCTPDGHCDR